MAERSELLRKITQLNRSGRPQRRVVRRYQRNQHAAVHDQSSKCARWREGPPLDRMAQKKFVILVRIAFTTTDEGE
jgi:hypothetical protein